MPPTFLSVTRNTWLISSYCDSSYSNQHLSDGDGNYLILTRTDLIMTRIDSTQVDTNQDIKIFWTKLSF